MDKASRGFVYLVSQPPPPPSSFQRCLYASWVLAQAWPQASPARAGARFAAAHLPGPLPASPHLSLRCRSSTQCRRQRTPSGRCMVAGSLHGRLLQTSRWGPSGSVTNCLAPASSAHCIARTAGLCTPRTRPSWPAHVHHRTASPPSCSSPPSTTSTLASEGPTRCAEHAACPWGTAAAAVSAHLDCRHGGPLLRWVGACPRRSPASCSPHTH